MSVELAKQYTGDIDTTGAVAMIQNLEINSHDDQEFAAELLRDVKSKHKIIETKRTSITKPMNVALREVNALFKPIKSQLEECEHILKGKIAGYQKQLAAKNMALVESVATAETPEEAQGMLTTIEPVQAATGVSVRQEWRFEVVCVGLLPEQMLMADEKAIKAHMKQVIAERGDPGSLPGVRFYQKDIVSSRS